jgi:hypothetical protein
MAASATPAAAAADETRVDTPGLHDATQVTPPPPSAPPVAPPPPPVAAPPIAPMPQAPVSAPPTDPGSVPWGPGSGGAPEGPATTAPWNPPASPAPPTWQQPIAPPGSATFGTTNAAAATDPNQPWAAQATSMPPTMWGATAPPPPAKGRGGSVLGGIAALAGGALTVLGIFSGWVTLDPGTDSETITAWSLTTGDELLKSNDPFVLAGLAAAAIVLGVLLFTGIARTAVRLLTIAAGIGIVAAAALNWASIASFVTDNLPTTFEASTAIGFYFVVAGGLLTTLAGLLPAKK